MTFSGSVGLLLLLLQRRFCWRNGLLLTMGASDSLSSLSDEEGTGGLAYHAMVRKREGSQPVKTLKSELYMWFSL